MAEALTRLHQAWSARLLGVSQSTAEDPAVIAYVGSGIPLELIDAAGLRAVRVCGDGGAPTPDADRVAEPAIDAMARSQIQRLIDGTYVGAGEVWVAHDTEASARVFHYASECRHRGAPLGEVVPVDLVRGNLPAQHDDRMAVLSDLRRRVEALAGRAVTDDDLAAGVTRSDERRRLVSELMAHRRGSRPRLGPVDALAIVGAAATLPAAEHVELLRGLLDDLGEPIEERGRFVILTGSAHDDAAVVEALAERGQLVVGEDHDWGPAWFEHTAGDHTPGADPLAALADRYGPRAAARTGRAPIAERAAHTAQLASECGAEVAVAMIRPGDDGPPWNVPAQREQLAAIGVELVVVRLDGYGADHLESSVDAIAAAVEHRPSASPRGSGGGGGGPGSERPPEQPSDSPRGGGGEGLGSERSPGRPSGSPVTEGGEGVGSERPPERPPGSPRGAGGRERVAGGGGSGGGAMPESRPDRLEASVAAATHQREWFAALREQVAEGVPLAMVNADAPHEILRAMGIPYVVNQWWASVCAARGQGPRYLAALSRLGFPDDIEAYSAMALGSAIDDDPVDAPWGGLPPVDLLVAETTTDATAKIFEAWSSHTGADLVLLDSTLAALTPRRWFDHIHDDWESVIGSRRLDLMVAELRDMVARLEVRTGRRLDLDRLAEVMARANEQAEWNARTRDLVAGAPAAPIDVGDAIPATMLPQWHRGSEWGRDAARRLHDEVAARVEAAESVVPDERVRLMWIGRGLWHDMAFYRHFQERHGAVFVWSMYLAVAADAYLRRGGDPMRALAARFTGFADLYNTPPWSSEWYAKEALHHRIDGVVHLTTDAVRGTHFITRSLRDAGVSVLEISGSNVDSRDWGRDATIAAVDAFIEDELPA